MINLVYINRYYTLSFNDIYGMYFLNVAAVILNNLLFFCIHVIVIWNAGKAYCAGVSQVITLKW